MVYSDPHGKTRTSSRVKNPTSLSDALHQRLNSYALAAGAAGVAVLACSSSAEAAPVCRSLSIEFLSNNTYALRPESQTFPPFQIAQTGSFYNTSNSSQSFSWNRAFFTPNSAGANVLLGPGGLAANLASGVSIGPGGQFGKAASYGMLFTYGKGFLGTKGGGTLLKHRGNFDLQLTNYIGFQFSQSGKNYYGWARLHVTFRKTTGKHKSTILHILGYGYETTPNTAIAAGSCSAPSSAGGTQSGSVPDATTPNSSASLGMLALGNHGLSQWRK